MKKKNLIFAVLMLSLVMLSCTKKDEPAPPVSSITASGELTLNVENGAALSSQIDSVICSIETSKTIIVGKALYKGSGLTLNLLSLPDASLSKVTDQFSGNGITISDLTALTSSMSGTFIEGYKGKKQVGYFFRTNMTVAQFAAPTAGNAMGAFIYSNKAVKITGTVPNGAGTADISLNKGWNEIIQTFTSATSVSVTANNEPSDMKWIYSSTMLTTSAPKKR